MDPAGQGVLGFVLEVRVWTLDRDTESVRQCVDRGTRPQDQHGAGFILVMRNVISAFSSCHKTEFQYF